MERLQIVSYNRLLPSMKRSITIITNYYPPETGAAANRIALLAENFAAAGYETHVLCPLPNYPTGKIFDDYKGSSGNSEILNGVKVTRLWVYATNSPRLWKRFLAMISFSISLGRYSLFHKLPSLVFVQYSPLLVGFFSTLFFKRKSRKLLLNVSDLWPLAGKELGKLKEGFTYRLLEKIERYCYRKADLVLGQSKEIGAHVKTLYPNKDIFLYRNLPNFNPPELEENTNDNKKMVYAGLLGFAQGILELCEAIELPSGWSFDIYGDGPQKQKIEAYLQQSTKNIRYRGSLSRNELHKQLQSYDLTIIPLINRIYGSVPSKIFEYGRLGLPMLYCGGGEGEELVLKNELGWVAPSGDFKGINNTLASIFANAQWPAKKEVQQRAVATFNGQKQFENLLKVLS